MGGFRTTVDSLLETYGKCLALLKGLNSNNPAGSERKASIDNPTQLRKSIRSDRSKVRRAYSTRLSQNGNHLEKGDALARSSLRRVIKRLNAAMARLLHVMTRAQQPAIDYESLRSLSNSSRIDAIRTINELSSRLPESTLGHSRAGGPKSRKSPSPKPAASQIMRHKRSSSSNNAVPRSKQSHSRLPPTGDIDPRKRASMATMSSGSTKIGEISNKLQRRRSESSTTSDEYSMQPTYPLRPYNPEVKPKRFWGLFSR